MCIKTFLPGIFLAVVLTLSHSCFAGHPKPKIINIVNFIRLLEPRDPAVTQDVLYQTVVKQVEIMKQYKLGGSFLLQYDALMDKRYQDLLKALPAASFEIGAWWEIPQPMVERAGLKWRGRYPWDWHADIGFSTGYTPAEREKLADVYMEDFKKIFGYYPKSVASWFIDSHTLNYLYDKYKIVASANCKDQVGTDGYTLWGGYWNQAYYASRINSYMPAQHESEQLPVPVFRLLGSDPVRQYDNGLGSDRQGVITLEPVYPEAGGDSAWVNWFFREFVSGESMEFAYTQAGQENSFTWDGMAKGFQIQMPLIARLRDEKKVIVQTLAQSGEWFSKKYRTTPATAVTITKDLGTSNRKTVWFNSKYYRINILWQDGKMMIRDIHLFDEKFPSKYTTEKATTSDCSFFTLPFVDGYMWSSPDERAGLYLRDNKQMGIEGGDPVVTSPAAGKLKISWPMKSLPGNLVIDLDERGMKMSTDKASGWSLDFLKGNGAILPFVSVTPSKIKCRFEQTDYAVTASQGSFVKPASDNSFLIKPAGNTLRIDFSRSVR